MTARILLVARKLGIPPGFWVDRARELFAGAFARTWPVEEPVRTEGCDEVMAPRIALMGKK